jgi:hypothetical protein
MNNDAINRLAIKKIAQALGELNEKVIGSFYYVYTS